MCVCVCVLGVCVCVCGGFKRIECESGHGRDSSTKTIGGREGRMGDRYNAINMIFLTVSIYLFKRSCLCP